MSSQGEIETSTAIAPPTARRTNPAAMAKTSTMTICFQAQVVGSHETCVRQKHEQEAPAEQRRCRDRQGDEERTPSGPRFGARAHRRQPGAAA